ncbi:MAG: class I tRNA ligase family protein [bacterium]
MIELQKDYAEAMKKTSFHDIQNRMIQIIKEDFCDKYLEIQKHQDTTNGDKVTLW